MINDVFEWKKMFYNSEFLICLHERLKLSFKLEFIMKAIDSKILSKFK